MSDNTFVYYPSMRHYITACNPLYTKIFDDEKLSRYNLLDFDQKCYKILRHTMFKSKCDLFVCNKIFSGIKYFMYLTDIKFDKGRNNAYHLMIVVDIRTGYRFLFEIKIGLKPEWDADHNKWKIAGMKRLYCGFCDCMNLNERDLTTVELVNEMGGKVNRLLDAFLWRNDILSVAVNGDTVMNSITKLLEETNILITTRLLIFFIYSYRRMIKSDVEAKMMNRAV